MAEPITDYSELKEHSSNAESDRCIPSCMEMYIMSLQVKFLDYSQVSVKFILVL